ncbi:MAG: LacI family DNA-binding transcriptional regulator, partial [Victivallaceae bacterium]|nr:LacI family DNA-binding transcriptional regulator [Victivallaceae bacterium]
MGQVTLKQLAELSGLSIRTVSRILRKEPNVMPEKREIVLALAEKYQYVPNMAARNLRLRRKEFVGILCGDFEQEAIIKKVQHLERSLVEKGYFPVLGRVDTPRTDFAKILNAWAGAVEYVIVLVPPGEGGVEALHHVAEKFPIRFIYVDSEGVPDSSVLLIDRCAAVADSVDLFFRRGCKRIAYVGSVVSRLPGIRLSFERNNRPFSELIRIKSAAEFTDGYASGPKLLKAKVDAAFFATDRMAAG